MFILSAAALVTNVWVFAAHVRTIVSKRRNPLTQEVHADEATYASWVRDLASDEDKNSSPRAWARRPRRRALHRRAWGNRAALLHGCPPIAPPVQVGGQPHSLKAFSRQEAARKGLSKFL